jgi:hypothetical protein
MRYDNTSLWERRKRGSDTWKIGTWGDESEEMGGSAGYYCMEASGAGHRIEIDTMMIPSFHNGTRTAITDEQLPTRSQDRI